MLMKKLITLILLLISFNVLAVPPVKDREIACDAPVTYEDGSVLPINEIGGYWIYWQVGGEYSDANRSAFVCDSAYKQIASTPLPDGEYPVAVTAFDLNGIESAYSTSMPGTVIKKQLAAPCLRKR